LRIPINKATNNYNLKFEDIFPADTTLPSTLGLFTRILTRAEFDREGLVGTENGITDSETG
jgi:hypothetical protein